MSVTSCYAIVNGQIVDIEDGSISHELDAFSTFDITIPAQNVNIRELRGKNVSVYVNGEEIISGFVNERPSYKFINNENSLVDLNCYDELGRLSCKRAKSNAHFQDQLVTDIIQNLMLIVPDWVIDFSTFPNNLTEKITIDLRSKETLFSQIVETVKSVPKLHLRYGGRNEFGQHILEIGEFDKISLVASQGSNITELDYKSSSSQIYNIVEAYGGFSATERVTLEDALSDPRTIVHPDYVNFPIVLDILTNTYYVENLLVNDGCEILKDFELTKTENNTKPTAQQIYEAGYALWRKAVRFLQSTDDSEIYEASLINKTVPRVGDRIYITATVRESSYDELGICRQDIKVFETRDHYKITKVDTDLEKYKIPDEFVCSEMNEELLFDIEVTNGQEAVLYDSELELFDRLDRVETVPNQEVLQISPVTNISVTHNGLDIADCDFNGIPNTGKEFIFNMPSVPVWATAKFFAVTVESPSTLQYEVTQYTQNNPSQSIILCVAPSTGDWNTVGAGENYQISIIVYFS